MDQELKYNPDDYVKYIGPEMINKHLTPNAIYKVSSYYPADGLICLQCDNFYGTRTYGEDLFTLHAEPSFKKGDLMECVHKYNIHDSVEIGIIYEAAFDSTLLSASSLPEEFVTLTEDENISRFVQYRADMFVKRELLSDEDLDAEPPVVETIKEPANDIPVAS